MTFEQDAARSRVAFDQFTAPALRYALNARIILPTEPRDGKYDSELAALLDQRAGIDGVIVDAEDWALTYASRVQFGYNYRSFSIRRSRPTGTKTEYDKLSAALSRAALPTTYHVQTFVDEGGQVATVAIAETADLMVYIAEQDSQWREAYDGATFFVIPWRQLENVKIYRVNSAGVVEDVTQKEKAALF